MFEAVDESDLPPGALIGIEAKEAVSHTRMSEINVHHPKLPFAAYTAVRCQITRISDELLDVVSLYKIELNRIHARCNI